jgi:hypothetical protein
MYTFVAIFYTPIVHDPHNLHNTYIVVNAGFLPLFVTPIVRISCHGLLDTPIVRADPTTLVGHPLRKSTFGVQCADGIQLVV